MVLWMIYVVYLLQREVRKINIKEMFIKYNFSTRNGKQIKFIVVHDTGNKSKGADAMAHYRYFNSGNRNASAHYFVDDKEIVQLVPDDKSAWHVGDGRGKFGILNSNSIGIEICVNSDGDYETAYNKTIELVKYLMEKHNIPFDNVVRHYDASRKSCPRSMMDNNWKLWKEFKEKLIEVPENGVKVMIDGKLHIMDGVFQNDKNYVSVRELAETLGHEVGWDKENQTVVIK